MVRNTRPQQVIDEVLEEVGLALGGLVVLHDVEDDFVRGLVCSLEAIRARTLRQFEDAAAQSSKEEPTVGTVRPHPAIKQFLAGIRRR
jgi:hypothetical protein